MPIPDKYVPIARLKVDRLLESSGPETRPSLLVADSDPAVAEIVHRYITEYEVVQVEKVDMLADQVMFHHPQAVVWNVPPMERKSTQGILSVSVPFIECSLPSQA